MREDRFSGKVAIVTGGAQGIGRAYCHGFSREGARVVVADVNGEKARATALELSGEGLGLTVDVSDEGSVQAMADAALARWGRIDILVNDAAIFSSLAMRPFLEIPLEEWDRVLAVQLRGCYLCARAVVPAMRAAGGGKIVNVSSSTVHLGRPNYLHYVTGKSGVIGFTRALAREVGRWGINVNTVTPGATETEVRRETMSEADWEETIRGNCLGRKGTQDDLVGPVLFLCSREADWVTGQLLNVDGGFAMH